MTSNTNLQLSTGARGPGVFFIIPCVDIYEKIDLRVQNFDVPPQEVNESFDQFKLYGCIYFSRSFCSSNFTFHSFLRQNFDVPLQEVNVSFDQFQ